MNMHEKALMIYHDHPTIIDDCQSPFKKMLFLIEASKLTIPQAPDYFAQAMKLAQAFDTRNDNTYYRSRLLQ